MSDLTVLVSPIPLYPNRSRFSFGSSQRRPIMVTLEMVSTIDDSDEGQEADTAINEPDTTTSRRSRHSVVDPNFLSPPVNTFRSKPRTSTHRPTRSQSAPPETRRVQQGDLKEQQLQFDQQPLSFPVRRPTISTPIGELVRPPPPLFRPTTFWRKTRRSGVTSASYSPASFLIRRSTYIAAGLKFDRPVHDLSALCVESRVEGVLCKATNEEGIPEAQQFRYHVTHAMVQIVSYSGPTSTLTADFDKRQVGVGFTLPLPLPLPTPAQNPTPNGSPIPLLISPYSPPSGPSSATVSSLPAIPTSISVYSTSSSPATPNNTANASNSNTTSKLTATTFLPFIILTSCFILALTGWCLHGWCTRRPKEKVFADFHANDWARSERRNSRKGWFAFRTKKDEEEELVCGPPYVGIGGSKFQRGLAAHGQASRFKWPSLSTNNRLEPRIYQNYLARNENADEEDEADGKYHDPFISKSRPNPLPDWVAYKQRSVPSKAHEDKPPVISPTTTKGPMSPTSIALRELYEVVLMGGEEGGEEAGKQTPLLDGGIASGSGVQTSSGGRKRRSHVKQGSESEGGGLVVDGVWKSSKSLARLEVRNPSVGEGRLGLREEEEDGYAPLPTPTRRHMSRGDHDGDFSPSRGRKPEPRPKDQQDAAQGPSSRPQPRRFVSKDVLPPHPKQIMTPPLENQMCFVPFQMPPLVDAAISPEGRGTAMLTGLSPDAESGDDDMDGSREVRSKQSESNSPSRSRDTFSPEYSRPAPSHEEQRIPRKEDDIRSSSATAPHTPPVPSSRNHDLTTEYAAKRKGSKGKLFKASPAAKAKSKT